jgi:hypothetical protein
MPTMRNGSRMSQTMGYRKRAANAKGQHRINRTHHSRNPNIASLHYMSTGTAPKGSEV